MKKRHVDEQAWYVEFKGFFKAWNSAGDEYLGDNPFDKFLYVEEAETWEDFVAWSKQLQDVWAFRGQSKADWALYPSLNRSLKVTGAGPNYRFSHQEPFKEFEDSLLFRFQRAAHLYVHHLPADNDLTGWLALMQHHGVPTRLLDWSMSPYVAAYFAMEKETEQAAVWAINLDWLDMRGSEILARKGRPPLPRNPHERIAYLNQILEDDDPESAPHMVVRVNPRKLDAWMAGQRGLFLCKCWDVPSLNQLVMRMMIYPEIVTSPMVRKLVISGDLRFDFLKQLSAANIHHGSLFPDLDGFSRSLNIDLQITIDSLRRQYQEQYEMSRRNSTGRAVEDDDDNTGQ